jgi:hypothetical protein
MAAPKRVMEVNKVSMAVELFLVTGDKGEVMRQVGGCVYRPDHLRGDASLLWGKDLSERAWLDLADGYPLTEVLL